MSRNIVQVIAASELRAGDVIIDVHQRTRSTVADVLLDSADQRAHWEGDDHVRALDFTRSVTVTFADRSADILGRRERVEVEPRDRSILVYRTRWTPGDDGHGGTTEPNYMEDTVEEIIDCEDGADTIDTTILRLRDLGVFGDSERLEMYRDPDGSRVIDYATGNREEITAVLRDFSEEDEQQIRYHIGTV